MESDSSYKDGQTVRVLAIVSKVKTQVTKNNKMMAFVNVEDQYGMAEMLVIPNVFDEYGLYFREGNIIDIVATVNIREDEDPKIICNKVKLVTKDTKPEPLKTYADYRNNREQVKAPTANRPVNPQKPKTLYIRIDNLESKSFKKAKRLLEIFEGRTPVVFYLTDTNKKLQAPQNLWVDLNSVLVNELKKQLGDDNIVAK